MSIESTGLKPVRIETEVSKKVPPILLEYGVNPKKEKLLTSRIFNPFSITKNETSRLPKESAPWWLLGKNKPG